MADGVVSISAYADSMIASLVTAPRLITIGPIDTDIFHPPATLVTEPAAICVSRIMPHKGIDRIIRALPHGLKLRVVGRVYHDEYRRMLGELAQGKDVEFIHDASDDDLTSYYHRSSIFLQASCVIDIYGTHVPKTELMGLTTLEAMACGLPVVVSSDGGSLPELVTDSQFGFVFETHDDLVDILKRHQLGMWPGPQAAQAARAHAVHMYGLSNYGKRLADFYVEALKGKRQRTRCEF
jgi:glycosyltransferase involved in cell wall biosynthesis